MSSPFLDTVRLKARGVMDRMAGPSLAPGTVQTAPMRQAPPPAPYHNGNGPTRYLDYNQLREVEDAIDEAIPMLDELRQFVDYRARNEIDATLAKLKRWSERLAQLRNNSYR